MSDIEDWKENKRKLLTIREKLAAMILASRSDSDSASSVHLKIKCRELKYLRNNEI